MTREAELRGPSALSAAVLVLANLYPLFGLVVLGWEVFPLVFLFWCEGAIIGFYTLAKLVVVTPQDGSSWGQKFIALPFFGTHYGGFLAFHRVEADPVRRAPDGGG